MTRRNYSDAYDPDMTAAEYHGWPTRAEADEDAAQPMTVQPRDCRGCGICFRCVLARRWGG